MTNLSFKSTYACGDDWQSVVDQCLKGLGTDAGSANFGFLYVTDALAPYLNNLLEALRTQTGVKDWIARSARVSAIPAWKSMMSQRPPSC